MKKRLKSFSFQKLYSLSYLWMGSIYICPYELFWYEVAYSLRSGFGSGRRVYDVVEQEPSAESFSLFIYLFTSDMDTFRSLVLNKNMIKHYMNWVQRTRLDYKMGGNNIWHGCVVKRRLFILVWLDKIK